MGNEHQTTEDTPLKESKLNETLRKKFAENLIQVATTFNFSAYTEERPFWNASTERRHAKYTNINFFEAEQKKLEISLDCVNCIYFTVFWTLYEQLSKDFEKRVVSNYFAKNLIVHGSWTKITISDTTYNIVNLGDGNPNCYSSIIPDVIDSELRPTSKLIQLLGRQIPMTLQTLNIFSRKHIKAGTILGFGARLPEERSEHRQNGDDQNMVCYEDIPEHVDYDKFSVFNHSPGLKLTTFREVCERVVTAVMRNHNVNELIVFDISKGYGLYTTAQEVHFEKLYQDIFDDLTQQENNL